MFSQNLEECLLSMGFEEVFFFLVSAFWYVPKVAGHVWTERFKPVKSSLQNVSSPGSSIDERNLAIQSDHMQNLQFFVEAFGAKVYMHIK